MGSGFALAHECVYFRRLDQLCAEIADSCGTWRDQSRRRPWFPRPSHCRGKRRCRNPACRRRAVCGCVPYVRVMVGAESLKAQV